jgi:hypothetical protein
MAHLPSFPNRYRTLPPLAADERAPLVISSKQTETNTTRPRARSPRETPIRCDPFAPRPHHRGHINPHPPAHFSSQNPKWKRRQAAQTRSHHAAAVSREHRRLTVRHGSPLSLSYPIFFTMFWRIPLTWFRPSFFSRALRPSSTGSRCRGQELRREIPWTPVHLELAGLATKCTSTS